MRRAKLLFLFCVPFLLHAQQTPPKTSWQPLDFFVGHWHGTSQGEPGRGSGQRDFEFVLRGKFLRVKNKIAYPPQERNPKGETHEDVGWYSYDNNRKKFVLRQFHVEGFVNEYIEQERSPDGKTIVFISERIENIPEGWRARETYRIMSPDEYKELFELAPPEKEFSTYSTSRWTRVK
jgi:hypothetical protein